MKNKFEVNDLVEIEIEKLAFKGYGFGKVDNIVFFVDYGVPGDKLLVKVYKSNKNYNFANIEKVIKSSEYRIESECPHFMNCGGCSHLNMEYSEQLKYKKILLKEIMRDFPVEIGDFKESEALHYRNKLLISLKYKNGKLINGLYAKGSHDLINIEDCLLQTDIVNNIKNRIIKFAEDYFSKSDLEKFRNLLIRVNKKGEFLICFVISGKVKFKEFAEILSKNEKSIVSIYNFLNNSKGNNLFDRSSKNSYYKDPLKHILGSKTLIETIKGYEFHIFPETFFQVNLTQLDNMIDIALNLGKEGETLIDMYSGIGFFGLNFRETFSNIYFIEKSPNASYTVSKEDEFNKSLFFYEEDIKKAIKKLLKKKVSSELIIIDPPRAGVTDEVIEAIKVIKPKKIIMISCNPTTMARDLKKLTELKYDVVNLTPIDNFPQTFHIECMGLLELRKC
jgi:23S rRNA (uracil1939-C5)-methyltransferase